MVEKLFPAILDEAHVRKRGKLLLGPVNSKLDCEGITILLGPNGSGKTTFLRLLHGLERCRDGTLSWNVDNEEAFRRQAFVFQSPIMLRRSVIENLAYPLAVHGADRKTARRKATDASRQVGLGQAQERNATVLSGGEKQKLAIARALITKPDVMFLDEPTTNLDGRSTREIEQMLLDARENGVSSFMATHDLGQARRLADHILFFYHGKLLEDQPADTFFNAPASPEATSFLKGDILE
jgi:tungstate transport system ATP-binding protein